MLYYLVTLSLLFSIRLSAQPPAVKVSLESVRKEYRELMSEMSAARGYFGREEWLRKFYLSAHQSLNSAIDELERDPEKAKGLLRFALLKYRRVGLLLPLVSLEGPDREETVQRYLAAEDALREAIHAVGAEPVILPEAKPYWVSGSVLWTALPAKLGQSEGQAACRSLKFEGTRDWHLPSFSELALDFRQMKHPSTNGAFGSKAVLYEEVWTTDEDSREPGTFLTLDFQLERAGRARFSRPLQVVCAGKRDLR